MTTMRSLPPIVKESQPSTVCKGFPSLDSVIPSKVDTATFGLG